MFDEDCRGGVRRGTSATEGRIVDLAARPRLLRRHVVVGVVAGLFGCWAFATSAQDFTKFKLNSEGPSPTIGDPNQINSRDVSQQAGSDTGAIQSVLVSPGAQGTIFVGAVNGGVWSSSDGGATWKALTDRQSSLAIGSMAFRSDLPSTIYAGTGLSSNGRYADVYNLKDGKPEADDVLTRGGKRTGILVSTDNGATWGQLAGSEGLIDRSVVGVAGRDNVVFAATAEYNDPSLTAGYGLYRSINGGKFELLSTDKLPQAPATSLVGSGTAASPYYVALAGKGVFRSVNNGNDWNQVSIPNNFEANQSARLAVASGGAVVVAVYSQTGKSSGQLQALYLAPTGSNWFTLPVPPVFTGGQANTDLAIAIDPGNPYIVYVAGDSTDPSPFMAPAYRINVATNGASTMESLNSKTSYSHPDARAFAFDASGRLLTAGDGGLYARSNPQSSSGSWIGLNGRDLAVRENYGVAYDAVSKRLVVASQDTGVALQNAPRSSNFAPINGGDGVNVAVNDRNTDRSLLYSSSQNLGNLDYGVYDKFGSYLDGKLLIDGKPTLKNGASSYWNFHKDDFDEKERLLPFSSRFLLNRVDPSEVAFGTRHVYLSTQAKLDEAAGKSEATPLTSVSDTLAAVTAMAYGTKTDQEYGTYAMIAGTGPRYSDSTDGGLYFSRDIRGDKKLSAANDYSGKTPSSIVFDADTWKRFYVADGETVWKGAATSSTSVTFGRAALDLAAIKIERPTALEFISYNGVSALLVGGMQSDTSAQSPIAVAMNKAGDLDPAKPFGANLPNAVVNLLSYNATVDVLAVGLWGRGVWTLYDVTSYFPTADKLIYGMADNNSQPDEYYLSNGNKASRDLVKMGTGTLTIEGKATYSGSTTVKTGMMVVNGSIDKDSKGLVVEASGTVAGFGTLPVTDVYGTMAPGAGRNAPTTIKVAKGYTQQAQSTYRVLVNGPGSDSVQVQEKANLAGGTVAAQVQTGTFFPSQTYTILTAAGGVEGTFSDAESNFPFLQPSLSYGSNNAYLTLSVGGFAAAAQNPVQAAVGNALDASVWQASGDYAAVMNALALLNTSQAQPVLTALSGMNYSGLSNSIVQGAQLFMSNFQAQAGGNTRQGNRIALAAACDTACDATQPGLWGAWGGAQGGVGTVGASQPLGGVTYNLGGFAGGLDRRFGENFLAGVALGYTTGTQWVSGFTSQSSTNTVQFGLYGSYTQGPAYLDGLAGYAYTSSQTSRSIAIPGLSPRTAVGMAGVNQLFGQVEGGWRFDIGTAAQAYVTPFARLQAFGGMQGAFSENGAQSLNLSVAAQNTYSLSTVFGAQLGGSMDLGWRDRLSAQLRLGWSHEYADTSRPVTAALAGAPSTPFTTYGVSPSRDGVLLGLSASTALADATSAYFRYEGLMAGQDSSHALTAGVRLTW